MDGRHDAKALEETSGRRTFGNDESELNGGEREALGRGKSQKRPSKKRVAATGYVENARTNTESWKVIKG